MTQHQKSPAARLTLGVTLVACTLACGGSPRTPVETFLDLTKRHLRTDDAWSGGVSEVAILTPTSWSYLGATTGNKMQISRLEALIAAKEQAVPLFDAALDRATDDNLRLGGGGGREKQQRIEAALEAFRGEIQADKDKKLALLSDPMGGGTHLRYEVKGTDGSTETYAFKVEKTRARWGIAEVSAESALSGQIPTPTDIARSRGIESP